MQEHRPIEMIRQVDLCIGQKEILIVGTRNGKEMGL